MIETKYLIIGNSAGGIGAAEAIREVDKVGDLTIVSDEPYAVYSRPLITKHLALQVSLESILYRPSDFYENNHIKTFLGKKVNVLGISRRCAELEGGEEIRWEKLLIATGGKPIVPKVRGLHKRGVYNFISYDDAKQLSNVLGGKQRVIVIGGGLIGISAAEALSKRGLKTTIIEMKDRLLNTILDGTASRLVGEAITNSGIETICNKTVSRIIGQAGKSDHVGGVILDDGNQLQCDLVVVAIGVSPRTDLVNGTSIETNHGILVDRYMATNVPGIYACGDVAEAYDFVYGLNRVIPIWPTANIGGRVAGYNMAGKKIEYDGGVAMNSMNYFGVPVVSAGMVSLSEGPGLEILTSMNGNNYRKVILKDNTIIGMVFVGEIERAGIIFGLMKDKVDVSSFKGALANGEFSLAAMPTPLRLKRREMSDWNFLHAVAA
jgi:NAD(P)H-nitrite reductase large subunit